MSRQIKPKPNAFDRGLDGLVKLRRTKRGREFVEQHREALGLALASLIGKP